MGLVGNGRFASNVNLFSQFVRKPDTTLLLPDRKPAHNKGLKLMADVVYNQTLVLST